MLVKRTALTLCCTLALALGLSCNASQTAENGGGDDGSGGAKTGGAGGKSTGSKGGAPGAGGRQTGGGGAQSSSGGVTGSGGSDSSGGVTGSGGSDSSGGVTGGGGTTGGGGRGGRDAGTPDVPAGSGGANGGGGSTGSGGANGTGGQSGGSGGSLGSSDCGSQAGLTWKTARKTTFTSYPVPGSEECIKYSGCKYQGLFSACNSRQTKEWVMSHNVAAFFPNFDNYKLHDICIRKGGKSMIVTAYDTCGDGDCGGCCTENKGSNDALIDLEDYTDARWGMPDGQIEWADLGPTKSGGCN